MGTICAPSYANIFISEFEERYIYPLIKNKSRNYLRFIEPNPTAIWKKCPKDDFVSKKILEIGVSSATIEFNDGGNGLKPVFNDLGLNSGYFIKKGLNKKHNLRIRQSVRKSCDRGKVSRKRLRAITKNWTDKENQAEGVKPSYSTGRF